MEFIRRVPGVEAVIVDKDGKVFYSDGLDAAAVSSRAPANCDPGPAAHRATTASLTRSRRPNDDPIRLPRANPSKGGDAKPPVFWGVNP